MIKSTFIDNLESIGEGIFEILKTLNISSDTNFELDMFMFRFCEKKGIIRFWKKDQNEIISEYDIVENGISVLKHESIESLTYVSTPRIEVGICQKDSPQVRFYWKKNDNVGELVHVKVDLGENKRREGDRIFVGYGRDINDFKARRGASMVSEKISIPPNLPSVLSGDKILGHKILWSIVFEPKAKKIFDESALQEFRKEIDKLISDKNLRFESFIKNKGFIKD
ncbi:MAG: hypothetical protein KAI71_02390 [Candidatus Pacebacteria bacterium]|nr:hypothetical protein [Candidatus Paceibacterota bacterium]